MRISENAWMEEDTFEQPLDSIWQVFTDPKTWRTWYGGELKRVDPGWELGASLTWAKGEPSTIEEYVSMEKVTIKGGSYGTVMRWTFIDLGDGKTLVRYMQSSGSLRVIDPARYGAQVDSTLQALKAQVEALRRGEDARSWWKFWK